MNITFDWKFILTLLVALFTALFGTTGCQAVPAAPSELGQMISTTMIKVADQGLLEQFVTDAAGQAIEPGVMAYGGVLYVGGLRVTGVSIQAGAHGSGTGQGALSAEARAKILNLFPSDPQTGSRILGIIEGLVNKTTTTQTTKAAAKPSE